MGGTRIDRYISSSEALGEASESESNGSFKGWAGGAAGLGALRTPLPEGPTLFQREGRSGIFGGGGGGAIQRSPAIHDQ